MLPLGVLKTWILLVCGVALGCSTNKQQTDAPDAATTVAESPSEGDAAVPHGDGAQASDETAPAIEPEARPTVTVASAGKEPRHVLRWDLKEGSTATLDLAMSVRAEMKLDGEARPPNATPPINTTLSLTVDERSPDGDVLIRLSVVGASIQKSDEISAEMAARIDQVLATMVGMGGSYRSDARGFVSDVQIQDPPGAPAAVRQTIENIRQAVRQMLAPLPETAIGRGAEWTVESQYEYSGMQVSELARFRATKVRPPLVIVEVSVEQNASPQQIVGANGQTGELESLATKSKGTNRWNLERVAKVVVERETHMDMTVKGPGTDGADHQIAMSIDLGVEINGR